jgi:predicted O-methyltransferase YrrM
LIVGYAGKSFTVDWTTPHLETLARLVSPTGVHDILEIGSWEGRSAIFFLEHCPDCRITCIDTFQGGREHAGMDQLTSVEARFDSNLAGYGDRIEKIGSRSIPALDRLAEEGRRFDLIYVDGSHDRDDVVLDSFLAWRLLRQDGLMIWDDYRWQLQLPLHKRPQEAIDFFLTMHTGELEVVHLLYQVFARKRAFDGQPRPLPGLKAPRTLNNLYRFLTGRPIDNLKT